MPGSYRKFDELVVETITKAFPNRRTRILDVGTGSGKFADLLRSHYDKIHGLEIHEPYVEHYKLDKKYDRLLLTDARSYTSYSNYDLVIFGDVLEHMAVEEAQAVLHRCRCCSVLVGVPFQYKQGPVLGNKFEGHVQDDLTPELVKERYPHLSVVIEDENYGIYIHGPKYNDKSVLIATPTNWSVMCVDYVKSLWNTQIELHRRGVNHGFTVQDGATPDRARNKMLAAFMDAETYTHVLFIDSDMAWSSVDVLRLLVMEKEFVAAAGPKKTDELNFAVGWRGPGVMENGFLKVDHVGGAFVLLSRNAVEIMQAAYEKLKIDSKDINPPSDNYYCLFQNGPSPFDGRDVSEDIMFCERWTQAGGKIWVDPSISLGHIGRKRYEGALSQLIEEWTEQYNQQQEKVENA